MSTVTVVPTVEPSNDPPRIRLDVTDTGAPNLFQTTVVRNDPDGRQVPVRTTDGGPLQLTTSGADRIGLLYDYEPQFGASVTYSTLESPATVSASVSLSSARAMLIHPGVPELSRQITIMEAGARQRASRRGVFYPSGRRYPVVQTGGQRQASEWALTLYVATEQERVDLDTLLDDESVLLLNVPVGSPWGIGAEYVSVGDVTEARVVRYLGEPARAVTLPLTVVERPAGGTQAERSLADLVAFPTLADIAAAYATLFDVAAGP